MIKTFLSALSVILFVIPIITYSFFPSSNLNIWLSTPTYLGTDLCLPLSYCNYGCYFKFRIFFPIFLQEK